jgi:L-malate glycosyltransferase
LMLDELVRKLPVEDVYFPGLVTDAELAAYYQAADLLVCMSEHEGFNVPMLEAMHANIPILAYNAASIPYTLDNAGVLVNRKEYAEIAEMMDLLITNHNLRNKILATQRQRLEFFQKPNMERLLKLYLDQVVTLA